MRNRSRRWFSRWLLLLPGLCLPLGPLRAEAPSCKEQCELEQQKKQRELQACLKEVDPYPPDRAAKMRLHCRQKYMIPRCEGLASCKAAKPVKAQVPGMKLSPLLFSTERGGAAASKPQFAAGGEVFIRLDAEIVSKPGATRVWLRQNLRMLAEDKKGSTREIFRWDAYADEQRFLDPMERGLPKQFTLHGGAKLPPDIDPGTYIMVAEVKELVSGFSKDVRGAFVVIKGKSKPR